VEISVGPVRVMKIKGGRERKMELKKKWIKSKGRTKSTTDPRLEKNRESFERA